MASVNTRKCKKIRELSKEFSARFEAQMYKQALSRTRTKKQKQYAAKGHRYRTRKANKVLSKSYAQCLKNTVPIPRDAIKQMKAYYTLADAAIKNKSVFH